MDPPLDVPHFNFDPGSHPRLTLLSRMPHPPSHSLGSPSSYTSQPSSPWPYVCYPYASPTPHRHPLVAAAAQHTVHLPPDHPTRSPSASPPEPPPLPAGRRRKRPWPASPELEPEASPPTRALSMERGDEGAGGGRRMQRAYPSPPHTSTSPRRPIPLPQLSPEHGALSPIEDDESTLEDETRDDSVEHTRPTPLSPPPTSPLRTRALPSDVSDPSAPPPAPPPFLARGRSTKRPHRARLSTTHFARPGTQPPLTPLSPAEPGGLSAVPEAEAEDPAAVPAPDATAMIPKEADADDGSDADEGAVPPEHFAPEHDYDYDARTSGLPRTLMFGATPERMPWDPPPASPPPLPASSSSSSRWGKQAAREPSSRWSPDSPPRVRLSRLHTTSASATTTNTITLPMDGVKESLSKSSTLESLDTPHTPFLHPDSLRMMGGTSRSSTLESLPPVTPASPTAGLPAVREDAGYDDARTEVDEEDGHWEEEEGNWKARDKDGLDIWGSREWVPEDVEMTDWSPSPRLNTVELHTHHGLFDSPTSYDPGFISFEMEDKRAMADESPRHRPVDLPPLDGAWFPPREPELGRSSNLLDGLDFNARPSPSAPPLAPSISSDGSTYASSPQLFTHDLPAVEDDPAGPRFPCSPGSSPWPSRPSSPHTDSAEEWTLYARSERSEASPPTSPARRSSIDLPAFDDAGVLQSPPPLQLHEDAVMHEPFAVLDSPSRRSSLDLPSFDDPMELTPSTPPSFEEHSGPSYAPLPDLDLIFSSPLAHPPSPDHSPKLRALPGALPDDTLVPASPPRGTPHPLLSPLPSPCASPGPEAPADAGSSGLLLELALPEDDLLASELGLSSSALLCPPGSNSDEGGEGSELAQLWAARVRATRAEHAARTAEAALAARIRAAEALLLDTPRAPDVRALAKDGSEELVVLPPEDTLKNREGELSPRVVLHALLAQRTEVRRARKRAKARARELAALLRIKLAVSPERAVAGQGGTKGPARDAAQLAAKMVYRRREAGERPLGARIGWVKGRSPLGREGDVDMG